MAANKKAKSAKSGAKKKAAASNKAAPKKKAAARRQAAPKKKATAKKKAAPKKKAAAAKKAAPKDSSPPSEAPAPTPKSAGPVSVSAVTLGNVFALRPRVNTGFRPPDFQQAKRDLADAGFATIEEATRAVAEKALELTRGASSRPGSPKRR